MREKFQRFMTGRYGADELSRVYLVVSLILFVVSMISRKSLFYWLGLVVLVYTYWRMFSKDIQKRYAENQKYRNLRYQAVVKKDQMKNRWAQRSTHRFFKCPQCRQTVRVPKGRGKICITCPKCKTEFIKKS